MKRLIPFVFLLALPATFAENMKSFDVLNKRLSVSMPEGARVEKRGHSIMAAPQSNESETRIVFEEGENKLVLMAWELFRRSGENYQEEISKAFKQWSESEGTPFDISEIGERVVMGIPKNPNDDDEAILYATALVRHKDDSVQRIGIYVNPEFHKSPDRCAELAKEIIGSLKVGERVLALDAGERKLDVLNEGFQMSLTVPEGWTYSTQQGVDFLVHNLQQVSDFGVSSAGIGIYIGGHPGYHHARIAEDKLIKRTRKARLFGELKEWIEYSTKGDDGWKGIEIISGIFPTGGYWKTHIFAGAKDDRDLDALLKIVATAKIEKKGR